MTLLRKMWSLHTCRVARDIDSQMRNVLFLSDWANIHLHKHTYSARTGNFEKPPDDQAWKYTCIRTDQHTYAYVLGRPDLEETQIAVFDDSKGSEKIFEFDHCFGPSSTQEEVILLYAHKPRHMRNEPLCLHSCIHLKANKETRSADMCPYLALLLTCVARGHISAFLQNETNVSQHHAYSYMFMCTYVLINTHTYALEGFLRGWGNGHLGTTWTQYVYIYIYIYIYTHI